MRIIAAISALLLLTASSAPFAEESLDRLEKRAGIGKIHDGIKAGDNGIFGLLPAKGFKTGLSGLLEKFNVFANPAYSFAECNDEAHVTASGREPGCVVSLKLAKKLSDGTFQDIGIRIEYAMGINEHTYSPNNSAYAQHAVNGDGLLDYALAESNAWK